MVMTMMMKRKVEYCCQPSGGQVLPLSLCQNCQHATIVAIVIVIVIVIIIVSIILFMLAIVAFVIIAIWVIVTYYHHQHNCHLCHRHHEHLCSHTHRQCLIVITNIFISFCAFQAVSMLFYISPLFSISRSACG